MREQGHPPPKQAWGGGTHCGQRGAASKQGLLLLSQVGKKQAHRMGPTGLEGAEASIDTICFSEQDTKAQSDKAVGRGAMSQRTPGLRAGIGVSCKFKKVRYFVFL